MARPSVVMDNGSGYTKMGFSGNMEPSFVIPTAVALSAADAVPGMATSAGDMLSASVACDMDYRVGQEALDAAASGGYHLSRPVQRGQIVDWDCMERLWLQCLYHFLRVDPEEHTVVLSENPMSAPEQRESIAEIMFETFNVKALYIAPQPVLSLMAANAAAQTPLTAVVVDAGESSVSVAPVVEGIVMPGSVRSIPVGGAHLNSLLLHMLRERGTEIPLAEVEALRIAQSIKETYAYTCSDVVKEATKHEKEPGKYRKLWQGRSRTRDAFQPSCKVPVGVERFLTVESLFSGDILSCFPKEEEAPASASVHEGTSHSAMAEAARTALKSLKGAGAGAGAGAGRVKEVPLEPLPSVSHSRIPPLPQLVDMAIQSAPIDTRRALYKTIVLSGGSSLFKDFGRRLQRDVKKLVDARLASGSGSGLIPSPSTRVDADSTPTSSTQKQSRLFSTTGAVDVTVVSYPVQDMGVWFGGSIIASTPAFPKLCHTREQYAEHGPSICRAYSPTTLI